jgi:hypothetical protein
MPDVIEVFGDGVSQVEVITTDESIVEVVVPGPAGADGADAGGVPVGGTTGQALVKNSNTDYDTEWADVVASPGGSTTQVQFNDSGAFAGDAGLTYDKTTNALTIGAGSLKFTGGTSGTVTIQPAATAGTYALTLPTDDGASGHALLTDGSGVLSWGAVGGTPGGSTTQVQYNNAGAFAGASGITTTGTEFTIASGTKTASAPVLDMSQTWNNAGVTFTGLKLNVTNTASANLSKILDLQVSGSTVAAVYPSYAGWSGATGTTTGVLLVTQVHGGGFTLSGGASSNKGLTLGQDGRIGFSSSSTPWPAASLSFDTILSRRGAANFRFGDADTGSPVAQTLSVQSVAAGTSNTAGANLTITGSQGTGTGAGGSIIFQVAPAGSTGSAQNALATALTLLSTKEALFEGNVSLQYAFGYQIYASGSTTNRQLIITNFSGDPIVNLGSDWKIGWGSSTTVNTSYDVALWRDAAASLALRNGTNAQTLRIYSTYTDASNYERGALNAGADYIELAAETAGTGDDNLDVRLTPAGTGAVRFGSHSAIAAETVTGYITIKDSGGTTRKIAVVS